MNNKVHEFYESLSKSHDALQTLGYGNMLKGLVLPTLNKLPSIKADLVRTDEEWGMENLIKALQKWLSPTAFFEKLRDSNPRTKNLTTSADFKCLRRCGKGRYYVSCIMFLVQNLFFVLKFYRLYTRANIVDSNTATTSHAVDSNTATHFPCH